MAISSAAAGPHSLTSNEQQDLHATLREVGPLTVIDLDGDLTLFADTAVNYAYQQAADRGARSILLNFGNVHHINSAGISTLIGILIAARSANRRLLVTGLTPHYQTIFAMMGLSRYAPVYESEDEARLAAGGRPQSRLLPAQSRRWAHAP